MKKEPRECDPQRFLLDGCDWSSIS
nr:hypothetical protein [Tanacetum cinerariifolium]